MNYQQRHVPFDYADLLRSTHGGEYPAERHWLDFKRELYPRPPASGAPAKAKSKKDVHEELARDLASLAVRGGYLVFGVEEDKAAHAFTVVDMPLPAHMSCANGAAPPAVLVVVDAHHDGDVRQSRRAWRA